MATEHAVASEKAALNGKDKKVTLTISTLSGDYTHDFPEQQKLQVVIDQTIEKLKLTGEGPWILEHNGVELSPTATIKAAGLKDDDVLTLNPQEGGGGTERQ
jgi:hypothetical protein